MNSENRDVDNTGAGQVPAEPAPEGKEAMRPIPDGGLQQSMPEWLRRPPAWRNLPKREEAVSPVSTGISSGLSARELPAPDTSEIDPRSLVDIADLPQWLQEVAARADARPAALVMIEPDLPQEEPKESLMTDPENRNPVEIGTERSIPFEPVDKRFKNVPEHETKTYGGGVPKQGVNPVVSGVIALAIIVVLVLILMAIF